MKGLAYYVSDVVLHCGDLKSEMDYRWESDEWHLAHKPRWDALESQGWQSRRPQDVFGHVGLTIFRGEDQYTMYVSRDWEPEEIHEELLERCEYHAARASL